MSIQSTLVVSSTLAVVTTGEIGHWDGLTAWDVISCVTVLYGAGPATSPPRTATLTW